MRGVRTLPLAELQGMKPLHTSMLVKRLQLTFPFRDRARSNFAYRQSEREWFNHHFIRSVSRAGCHESGLSVLNGGFWE